MRQGCALPQTAPPGRARPICKKAGLQGSQVTKLDDPLPWQCPTDRPRYCQRLRSFRRGLVPLWGQASAGGADPAPSTPVTAGPQALRALHATRRGKDGTGGS